MSKRNPWINKELINMRRVSDTNRIAVNKSLLDEREYKINNNKTRKLAQERHKILWT